jgi:hypothetical protein
MERYDDALADLNRAIELRPSRVHYIARKDEIRRLMGTARTHNPGQRVHNSPQMAKDRVWLYHYTVFRPFPFASYSGTPGGLVVRGTPPKSAWLLSAEFSLVE